MGKLNKTISGMVVAIAADYPRMKKMLEGGNVTRDQAVLFTRYVSAVDNALIAVCRGEPAEARELLRKDIAEKNGFFAEVIKDFSANDRVIVLKKA